jgi:hypothetical protein
MHLGVNSSEFFVMREELNPRSNKSSEIGLLKSADPKQQHRGADVTGISLVQNNDAKALGSNVRGEWRTRHGRVPLLIRSS